MENQDQEHEAVSTNGISHADWLNEHQSAEEQYHYVESQNFRHSQDPELLWRFGRACHCVYSYSVASTKEVKAAAIKDGLKAVEKAVQLDLCNANAFVVSLYDCTDGTGYHRNFHQALK